MGHKLKMLAVFALGALLLLHPDLADAKKRRGKLNPLPAVGATCTVKRKVGARTKISRKKGRRVAVAKDTSLEIVRHLKKWVKAKTPDGIVFVRRKSIRRFCVIDERLTQTAPAQETPPLEAPLEATATPPGEPAPGAAVAAKPTETTSAEKTPATDTPVAATDTPPSPGDPTGSTAPALAPDPLKPEPKEAPPEKAPLPDAPLAPDPVEAPPEAAPTPAPTPEPAAPKVPPTPDLTTPPTAPTADITAAPPKKSETISGAQLLGWGVTGIGVLSFGFVGTLSHKADQLKQEVNELEDKVKEDESYKEKHTQKKFQYETATNQALAAGGMSATLTCFGIALLLKALDDAPATPPTTPPEAQSAIEWNWQVGARYLGISGSF